MYGNYEKRTELRVIKIRPTVTKRQKFLLTGSKNNYPAERRHISCNYRMTRVRRVNIIARMRPDGIYTENTRARARTHVYTRTYTVWQWHDSYTDSAISTPWIADIEFPPTKPRIAAGVTWETLFLLILRDHCFKHRCTPIETINRSPARIRYHNLIFLRMETYDEQTREDENYVNERSYLRILINTCHGIFIRIK